MHSLIKNIQVFFISTILKRTTKARKYYIIMSMNKALLHH